jgi:hypothetical protein
MINAEIIRPIKTINVRINRTLNTRDRPTRIVRTNANKIKALRRIDHKAVNNLLSFCIIKEPCISPPDFKLKIWR